MARLLRRRNRNRNRNRTRTRTPRGKSMQFMSASRRSIRTSAVHAFLVRSPNPVFPPRIIEFRAAGIDSPAWSASDLRQALALSGDASTAISSNTGASTSAAIAARRACSRGAYRCLSTPTSGLRGQMPVTPAGPLTVAISARALFDF